MRDKVADEREKRPARNTDADNYSWKDPSSWLYNWSTGGLYDASRNENDFNSEFDSDYVLEDEDAEEPVGFWSDFEVSSHIVIP